MKAEEFNEVLSYVVSHINSSLSAKAEEYATDNDRLRNFKIAASLTENTPKQAAWGMLVKHLVSISDMIQNDQTKTYTPEMWDEKIGDAINYLILIRALEFEEKSYQFTVQTNANTKF